MRILLLTTLPNRVAETLRHSAQTDIIDCRDYSTIDVRLRDYLSHHQPDRIITYRCPYILPRELYSQALYGAVNIHPSLLPKYKGLNPWEALLLSGETRTGVTIHRITDEVDGGGIILQEAFDFDPTTPLEQLREQADKLAADMISRHYVIPS